MGKGDKKSRKGKIAMGSYGNSRPHHVKKDAPVAVAKEEKAAPAKAEKAKKPSA
jgi:30S ribosomal protein S31